MTTLDDLLADASRVVDPTPEVLIGGRLRMEAAVAPQSATPRRSLLGAPSTRRRGWRVVAVTASAAAVVLVAPTLALHGGQPASSAAAATVLRQAGQASANQGAGWPDAAYWYSASVHTDGGQTYRREIWIGHHAPSVLRDPGVAPGLIPLDTSVFPAGGTSLTWDQLYALPTDASALRATLVADIHGAGNGDDAELFVIVGDLLRESPAPPLLRQALYNVAAGIPGVQLVGQVTDPEGRTGTAVERDGQEYIIDVDSGQLLDETDNGFESTYLTQGPATSAPALK